MIAPSFLSDLLARADIVEVVGRHVELRKAGINHKGLCPFHGEKTPSFIVSPSRQTYHCFGCGAHGNAIGFLMEHGAMGFVEAVHALAEQVGVTVPEDEQSPEQREQQRRQQEQRATLSDVLARAARHYRRALRESERAKQYLKGRGLTGEIAQRFGLGYAPDGWRGLASVFPSYDDPLLAESGLVIVQGEEAAEQRRYDRFRDRVMFPIRAVQGDIIGFGGRVLDGGEPKYLNSPETPVFVKGRELYGLFEARQAIRQRGYVLVVEGYMDVVALAQSGLENAVATLGTACTAEHVAKLFRFTESVVFSFDGDAAGRRAAGRALEASLPHAGDTRSIRFLFLPPEHDPDSYVREHGVEAFEQCVAQAVPLSRQLVEQAGDGLDLATAEGRARLLAQARPLWSALPDGALRRNLLGELATLGGVGADDLRELWLGERRETRARREAAEGPRAARRAPRGVGRSVTNLLDRALWLLVHRAELWDGLDGNSHDLLAGRPDPHGLLFSALERGLHEHGSMGAAGIVEHLRAEAADDAAAQALLARVAALHEPMPEADGADDLAAVLRGLRLQDIGAELELLYGSGELSAEAQSSARQLEDERRRLKTAVSAPV